MDEPSASPTSLSAAKPFSSNRSNRYAFAPSRRCYLLPVAPPQRAWRLNGRHWIERYGERLALNPGYGSNNVPVSIKTLMAAIKAAMLL